MNEFDGCNKAHEENAHFEVTCHDFAKALNLKIAYAPKEDAVMLLKTVNVNRPGLYLADSTDYFAGSRIQVFGNAELYFMHSKNHETKVRLYGALMGEGIPAVIVCRDIQPSSELLSAAEEHKVPVFLTDKITTELITNLTEYLNDVLAVRGSLHGVLLDVLGVGVFLTGDSGIGKSETALELVHRGHRLVADDAVLIKRIKGSLIGTSPELIRYMMEIRGVGIIDIRQMFGIGATLSEKRIHLVIELEKWDLEKEYDRIGRETLYTDILGVKVPKLVIPVIPGRNLAIVIEVAARNYRLKDAGYNAAEALEVRLTGKGGK